MLNRNPDVTRIHCSVLLADFLTLEEDMDNRRLNTGDILAMGITSLPCPETDIPKGRDTFECEGEDWNFVGAEKVIEAIENGLVATSSNYYGIPYVWKVADDTYKGCLLQYRAVSESPIFSDAESAVEWFENTYYATYG